MRKSLLLVGAILMVAGAANATILVSENFDYADGALITANPSWLNHSGTIGDLMVVGGQAYVKHGTPSEDAHIMFTPAAGTVMFAADITVEDMGTPFAGTDAEYFIHFMIDGTYTFAGRTDISAPTGAGDFTIGIATTSSTAEATWPTDLYYGVTYRLVVAYDPFAGLCYLWIDPAGAESTFISSTTVVTDLALDSVALRQSDSSMNEGIYVDNLIVSDSCYDIFDVCPPVSTDDVSLDQLKSLYR